MKRQELLENCKEDLKKVNQDLKTYFKDDLLRALKRTIESVEKLGEDEPITNAKRELFDIKYLLNQIEQKTRYKEEIEHNINLLETE